ADLRVDGRRRRTAFDAPQADLGALRAQLLECARRVT
ncbi:pyridoxamine 5'-phosphate oxidase, partial [Paraburkholderia sp. Se-20369]|nr:pyridoxamine 5'-phosphate oxidase [Paraburkholderia sp. Se-20369]